MGRNILTDPSSCFWCEPLSSVFAAGQCDHHLFYQMHPPSTQHGICTDYFIMKSNCYEVILRPKKPKTMDSSLINDYYQLLESHGLFHFVLSVFIYMKCYFIQDFIVIKSSKKTQLQFVNCRTRHTQKCSVTSIWFELEAELLSRCRVA